MRRRCASTEPGSWGPAEAQGVVAPSGGWSIFSNLHAVFCAWSIQEQAIRAPAGATRAPPVRAETAPRYQPAERAARRRIVESHALPTAGPRTAPSRPRGRSPAPSDLSRTPAARPTDRAPLADARAGAFRRGPGGVCLVFDERPEAPLDAHHRQNGVARLGEAQHQLCFDRRGREQRRFEVALFHAGAVDQDQSLDPHRGHGSE